MTTTTKEMTATQTWGAAFAQTIGSIKGYKKRLKELQTWDKPFVAKENDKSGKWAEWANKCIALENLIN